MKKLLLLFSMLMCLTTLMAQTKKNTSKLQLTTPVVLSVAGDVEKKKNDYLLQKKLKLNNTQKKNPTSPAPEIILPAANK